jgi:hypothetical protein
MPLIRLTSNADGEEMWVSSAHIVAITQEKSRDSLNKVSRIITTSGVFTVREEAEYIANKPALQYTGRK